MTKLSPTMKQMLQRLDRGGPRMFGCTHPTLSALEKRKLVECGKINVIGFADWSITDAGREAIK